MTTYQFHLLFAIAVILATAALLRLFIPWMNRRDVLDVPNQRSSHSTPVPTGGGWVLLGVALTAWVAAQAAQGDGGSALGIVLLGAALLLMLISWLDDRRPLPPTVRFGVQLFCVALCLYQLPMDRNITFAALPLWADRLLVGFCWLWFINLYNFMDGIDGMAASETIAICLGVSVLGHWIALNDDWLLLALLLGAASLGFLTVNWHPARIFLGDVGAVPLGFLMGWLMIQLALNGQIAAAIILPLYYVTDATLTLLARIWRGEKFWRAHREHFYQAPVVAGHPHSAVVLRIIAGNCCLLAAALVSITAPMLGLAMAAVVVALVLMALRRLAFARPAHV